MIHLSNSNIDHFVYNSHYGESSGSSGSNAVTYSNSGSLPWEYTTQKTTRTTPIFVYEEPNLYTQPQTQYQEYTTRPSRTTIKPTRTSTIRTTTRSTTKVTSTNYWPGTTESNQHQSQNQYNEQNLYNQQNYNSQQNQHKPQNHQNCQPSITTVNKERVNCKGTLIFEEQFDQGLLDRWSQDVRMPLEFEVSIFI